MPAQASTELAESRILITLRTPSGALRQVLSAVHVAVDSSAVSSVSLGLDAVLFDFGGVLTTSPFAAMTAFGEEIGVGGETFLRLFIGPSEDSDHPFHRAERGELDAATAFNEIRAHAHAKGIDISSMGARITMDPVSTMIAYASRLRDEGVKTALVSNNFKEMAGQWRKIVDIDDLFTVVVESYAEGVRKPAAAIYLRTLERLGDVDPTRAVFLDDLPDNVEGARRVGMHAVLVGEDHDAAIDAVERLRGEEAA